MSKSDSKSLHDRINTTLQSLPPSGIREFFDIVSEMDDVISMGVGEPDFVTPWHIREASIYALEKGATAYTSNAGLSSLRKAISTYVHRAYGLDYAWEHEILITVGVSEALDLAVRALVNPGDEIVYHEPCYVSYQPMIALSGGVPVAINTQEKNEFRVTPEELEAVITPRTKAVMLNFPNNPTGAYLPPDHVKRLCEVIKKHDLILVTDEIYSELSYEYEHLSPAAIPGMKERTIFLHGFSKALAMTGFRVGYACGPAPLIGAMHKIHQYSMLCAPILSQKAAEEALRYPEEDIAVMKRAYDQRRKYLIASMEELGISMFRPGGAFYIFPNIARFGISSREFAIRFLEQEKVAVVPGTAFGPCGEGFIRCSYATSLEEIKEAMGRLGRFIATL